MDARSRIDERISPSLSVSLSLS
eukprot:SAG31_NODE_12601_length_930_cov_1.306859_1_plen_22_part_10